jgi:hypothetical protein
MSSTGARVIDGDRCGNPFFCCALIHKKTDINYKFPRSGDNLRHSPLDNIVKS